MVSEVASVRLGVRTVARTLGGSAGTRVQLGIGLAPELLVENTGCKRVSKEDTHDLLLQLAFFHKAGMAGMTGTY